MKQKVVRTVRFAVRRSDLEIRGAAGAWLSVYVSEPRSEFKLRTKMVVRVRRQPVAKQMKNERKETETNPPP